ncbi:STAS domain-containing protein [Cytobacillus oceanisediminis]|uniref:STAS domain-containing protein n=1 Tax=Niallia alba TaxID=2729105 RepID=A0A7Y0K4U8_9BACI|nr:MULTISPECIES: STAS domain-containing protein [Bacillaceae]MBZ9537210.1 STAS domain-containing protein [Cytobacillus oceanisediminis]NMO75716.1 STAS domain-containing protein [Niallia alba]UTI43511.1 STAS domain-containing protein [Niallia sp. RD1]
MGKNNELHAFLLNKASQLTEEWYNSLDKNDPTGVYSSSDPKVIKTLKEQNFEFHLNLCEIFIEEDALMLQKFNTWVQKVARDKEHLNTPIHFIIREFIRVRKQYLEFIEEFVSENEGDIDNQIEKWNEMIIDAFDFAILQFSEETHKYSSSQLEAQQEMINELSSPIITLNNDMALLPLVGDIDTARAKFIIESTLNQCADKGITDLFIDLSGVVMVDTLVAQRIFHLIEALRLIGVTTIISGIRPEIAQTAVQLGLSFNNIITKSTLSQAITFKTEKSIVSRQM